MKVQHADFRFSLRGIPTCCGLSEMGDFRFNALDSYAASLKDTLEVEPREVVRIKQELQYTASTFAVTVDHKESAPTQWCAGQVLKAVGFKEAHRFFGNGGNPLILWVYDR